MAGLPSTSARRASKEGSPERPLAQPPRFKSACESCHSSKVKCTGKQPCARCASNGWDCVYKLASRIGKPKGSRNKSTLRRLQMEAEQAERELASKSASTTSTGSSPLPPTPITSCTASSGSGLPCTGDQKEPLAITAGFADWQWTSDAEFWVSGAGSDASLQSAIGVVDPVGLGSPANPIFAFEEAIPSYERLTSSAESIHPSLPSHNDLRPSDRSRGSDRERFGSDGLSYLGPEDAYDFPQWSPSLAMESHSTGTPSPAYTWLAPDGASGFDYSDPHWTAEPCPCIRNLSWQLGRIDQLRQALTINTTLRAFMYEANESIQCIRGFLKCQICDKDSTGLSLMVTMFTNINHLFSLTLSQTLDPLGQHIRDRSYGLNIVDPERFSSEEAIVRGQIQRWLRTSEHALRLVQGLRRRASTHSEVGPSRLNTKRANPPDNDQIALWGSPDLGSFGEMLWRVKQNLSTYA